MRADAGRTAVGDRAGWRRVESLFSGAPSVLWGCFRAGLGKTSAGAEVVEGGAWCERSTTWSGEGGGR
jgi:hypothetical protein